MNYKSKAGDGMNVNTAPLRPETLKANDGAVACQLSVLTPVIEY